MRIINLDATGIKLISSKRKQIYLTKAEVHQLLARDYCINKNILNIANKKLELSDTDVEEFDKTLMYIKTNFS